MNDLSSMVGNLKANCSLQHIQIPDHSECIDQFDSLRDASHTSGIWCEKMTESGVLILWRCHFFRDQSDRLRLFQSEISLLVLARLSPL